MLITAGVLLLLAAVFVTAEALWAQLLILAIVGGCSVFAVRGYSVIDGELLIHRLGWATRYPLDDLRSVRFEPGVSMGSIRLFGIGGLFGYIGRYRNASIGSYRAYMTDRSRTVVLKFGETPVVVTPDEPKRFAELIEEYQ